MTVKEVIEKVASLRRNNQFTIEDKMRWLNQCEAKVQLECLLLPCVKLTYSYDVDAEEELIVKPPYDELYLYYVCAKIDEALGEMEMYNNTIKLYNDVHGDFQKWLIRHVDPAHNKVEIERSATQIFRGDKAKITFYGLPVTADEISSAKIVLTQGGVRTEFAEVTLKENTISVQLDEKQTYALKDGSLLAGYDILADGYRYRDEEAKRFYVSLAPDLAGEGEIKESRTDKTLSFYGRAADAGAVGEKFNNFIIIGGTQPTVGPVLWFNTGKATNQTRSVLLYVSDDTESDVQAEIDGENYGVENMEQTSFVSPPYDFTII